MVNRNWGDYSIDGGAAGRPWQNGFVQAAGGFGIRVEKLAGLHTIGQLYSDFTCPDAYLLAYQLLSAVRVRAFCKI
jgi:hypothetical protein